MEQLSAPSEERATPSPLVPALGSFSDKECAASAQRSRAASRDSSAEPEFRNFLFGSFASIHSLDGCLPSVPTTPSGIRPAAAPLLSAPSDSVDLGGASSAQQASAAPTSSSTSQGGVATQQLSLPLSPCPLPATPSLQAVLQGLLDGCSARAGPGLRPLCAHLGLPQPPTQLLEAGQTLEATHPPIPIEAWHSALASLRAEAQAAKAAQQHRQHRQSESELAGARLQQATAAAQQAAKERGMANVFATGIAMAEDREAKAAAAGAGGGAEAASAAAAAAATAASGCSHRTAPLPPTLADKILSPLVPTTGAAEEGADPKAAESDKLFHLHARERCKASKLPALIKGHVFSIFRVPRGKAWAPPSLAPIATATPAALGSTSSSSAGSSAASPPSTSSEAEALLRQVAAVHAISGNHGVGAKVAVWAVLFELLYGASAAAGRQPLPVSSTSTSSTSSSEAVPTSATLKAALTDFRYYAQRVSAGLAQRYAWLERLQQAPGAGEGAAGAAGRGAGGAGGGGGSAGGSPPPLRLLPCLRLCVTEALHACAYHTLFPLHAAVHRAEDAAAAGALAAAARLPPSAFGLPAWYDSNSSSSSSAGVQGVGESREDPAGAALAARVYAPCIEALRFLCTQVTPMSKLGALLVAVRCIQVCGGVEAALGGRGGGEAAAAAAAAAAGSSGGGGLPPLSPPATGAAAGSPLPPLSPPLRAQPKVFTADDVMPRLCFVLAQAWGGQQQQQQQRPFAQVSYMEEGIPEDKVNGEEAYFLISLRGALQHVVDLGGGAE